ncbi:hypothetical protein BHF69_09690 [Anaerostipes sp. 992a]|uniref:glycosyltransferase family 1 protein n=1 Tax=Anaerostipes sp. 992a TaxID=1261637 RepID=UPI00095362A9|nr:glycosyltransferase family 1 protein [Anaerostipes sp. 992a]OLR62927.1 hypothetical protein BHF69_09690 [Anaerostipes sp. 992a]
MNKILVFGMTNNPGGVESVIMNYYRNINREKIQFDFLCNSQVVAYEDEIKSLGGKIYKITARKDNYFKFKRELRAFMSGNAFKYSAIWVNICSLVNIDYLIFAKKYGITRRIIHCHNSDNDAGFIKSCVHKFNKMRIGKIATDFWSCSEEASPWFFDKTVIQGEAYKIITNAIDVKKYKQNDALRKKYRSEFGLENNIVVGHVGRFHFQKNHKFLIDIFEELVKRNSQYHLLLVGQGELEEEIKKIVKEKGLMKQVSFTGVRMDVENLYQMMDIFVLPSVFEGLGIVALEAQAASLPCLLADTVPPIVKVNDNVEFLALNQKIDLWADRIEQLIQESDKKWMNKLEVSEFNIETQVRNFERMLFNENKY